MRRSGPARLSLLLAAVLGVVPARAGVADDPAPSSTAGDTTGAPGGSWPFSVGEEAVYRLGVALGPAPPTPVGTARLAVEACEPVDGRPAYRVVREMEGRIPFVYRVDDRRTSWIAPDPFRSLRFEERLQEGDYRRHRRYRLDHDRRRYTRWDRSPDGAGWERVDGETAVPMPPAALDEVAFLYFVRTLPLAVGTVRRFDRLFEADESPVELTVLRRDRVRVPAGTYGTVVVRPVIRADGLFGRDGRAEVHVSDDARRIIVKIEARTEVGRIDLSLEEYRSGADAGSPGEAGPTGCGGPGRRSPPVERTGPDPHRPTEPGVRAEGAGVRLLRGSSGEPIFRRRGGAALLPRPRTLLTGERTPANPRSEDRIG